MRTVTYFRHILLFITGSCFFFSVQGQQQSYFQQSSAIAAISQLYTGTMYVDGKTKEPQPSDKKSFNSLLSKITAALGFTKNKTSAIDSLRNSARDTLPPVPPPGELSNHGAGPNAAMADAEQEYAADDADLAGLERELRYILFLGKNSTAADYIAVNEPPAAFRYLNSMVTAKDAGAFNSGTSPTGFAFSESAIIYGLTDFIIQRAKQQLVSVYLGKWQDQLEGNCVTKTLLPHTLAVTRAFLDDNALNLAVFGDQFKSAYQEDFRNFPMVLQDASTIDSLLRCLGIPNAEISACISGGTKLVYDLSLKKHLVTILDEMSGNYLSETPSVTVPSFKKAVVMGDMLADVCGYISDAHTSKFDTYITVSAAELKKMDAPSWQVFFRLFFLKKRNSIAYLSATGFAANAIRLMNMSLPDIQKAAVYFNQTISLLKSYQVQISGEALKPTHLDFAATRKIFDLSLQLFGNVSNHLLLLDTAQMGLNFSRVTTYFRFAAEIGEGVSTQQYAKLVAGVAGILTTASAGTGNVAAQDAARYLQRYGSFMINILSAKTPDEVKAALNELIPADNYLLKNRSAFTISLSSYPGLFLGAEKVPVYQTNTLGTPNTGLPKTGNTSFSAAAFLPIGLDFNLGLKKAKSSINLFMQVLDLGAVLNYRINGDNQVDSDPPLSFKQLVSPGLSVMFHLPRSPLVLGANGSYTPSLRTIHQAGNTYTSGASRLGFFIAVDVTFFHLYLSRKTR